MCKKSILFVTFILMLSLISGTVQAELKLVGNFDSLVAVGPDGTSADGQACTGVLGGTWDTETELTGSVDLVTYDGSRVITHMSHSNGVDGRAIGFNGINNPIEDDETGIAFLRFQARHTGYVTRTFIGLITDTSDDPIDVTSCNDPMSIAAGVFCIDDDSSNLQLLTLDRETVLMAEFAAQQWYNIWIVANNETDTFDLYMSEADAPAGKPTLPTPADLIQADIPFVTATTDPLTGMIVSSPGGSGPSDRTDRIWADEFWWDGDQGLEPPKKAKEPSPASNAKDVARDVVLIWKPAPSAVAHDVYFGENAEDVALATTDDPRGVLVSPAQDANAYAPETLLELGKTYYWRIDEVNDSDPGSPYVGTVWSFEVEPVAFALTQANITVTASGSADNDQIPENTINGSGLDTDGGHGVEDNTMWLSSEDSNGARIEYVFDKTYKMYEMSVWNHNTSDESNIGLGMKDVVVSYSTDGTNWTPVADVNQLTQAPGLEGYQANTIIDLSDVMASHIRIEASSNWGGVNSFGLSEVRFSVIPTAARLPYPESGTVDLDPAAGVLLSWRAGREAAQHVLYLSTDEQAVIDGSAPMILSDAEYPAMNLDVNSIYYWRVDEVNNAETPEFWPGEVWNFSTVETLVVDDFEEYDNEPPFMVFQTWVDGLGVNGNNWEPIIPSIPGNGTGALVGHDIWSLNSPHYLGDIMEKSNPHGGAQCMPLYYQNGESPFVSEATRTFESPRNWTNHNIDTLGIWYRGASAVDSFTYDSGAQTYSVIAAGGNIANAGGKVDTFYFVYKKLTGNGEIVVKVESVDPVHPWSKAGVMIRQGLEPGGRHAFMGITPESGVTFVWRKNIDGGAETTDVAGYLPPYWLKLTRSGIISQTMSAFISADGSTWEAVGYPRTVYMSGDIYIGMAVSSHESRADTPCEAVFSNVSASGSVAAGVFTDAASITVDTFNMPERLYAAISDTSGKRIEVELDPTGTAQNGWTLGTVDLTSISGTFDITGIKELAIGVGDGAAGSDGLVFIDDIYLFGAN